MKTITQPLTADMRKRLEDLVPVLEKDCETLRERQTLGKFAHRADFRMVAEIERFPLSSECPEAQPSQGELLQWGRVIFNIVQTGDTGPLHDLIKLVERSHSKQALRGITSKSIAETLPKGNPGSEIPPEPLYCCAALFVINAALHDDVRPLKTALAQRMNHERETVGLLALGEESLARTLKAYLRKRKMNDVFVGGQRGRPKGSKRAI